MTSFVGIDLGTTYSAVAYIDTQGKPQIIPNERGRSITPSVIYFGAGTPLVGDEAKEFQAAGHPEIAAFFKRSIDDTHYLLSFHGQDYTPVDLSALVLAYLKRQAEDYLKASVTHSVITVPAYFTHVQRSAVLEAGLKAGLQVLKIISEPTAAALAYGLRPSQKDQRVLVYDLGGGTFDVSLVEISSTDLRVIATSGDHSLGGKDWDDRLIAHIAHEFENEFGLELLGSDVNEIRIKAEQAKFALSARKSTDVSVHAGGKTGTYTIQREQFEQLTHDLMERTQLLTEQVLMEAGIQWSDLTGVLPVGGSTRMPMVREYIERMSGKPPMGGIHPDEAVALGAAIQATVEMEQASPKRSKTYPLLGRKSTTDAIAHSLGMIAENMDRSAYTNSIIIGKNQPIPSSQTHPYQQGKRRRGDTMLEVFLTQGESENPQNCTYLGRYVFTNFPAGSSSTVILDITYHYDKNGVVTISAVERSTGMPLTLKVEPVPPDVPARFAGRPPELQQIREHLTIYLAFDLSGSMTGEPLEAAQRAAEEFVSQCDLSTTSIGLISFSDRVHVDLAATQNGKEINRAIRKLSIGVTGFGNEGHPFDEIYKRLNIAKGLRYAVVLADGVWSHQSHAIKQAKRCHAAEMEIIAIGFGGADQRFLRQIASSTEQSFFTDMNRLTETFSTIAQELTSR